MVGGRVWSWVHGIAEVTSEKELKEEWGGDKRKSKRKLEVRFFKKDKTFKTFH